MSIKREVLTRNQVYTIYSSELQERMKVYFQLNEEYELCLNKCPRLLNDSQNDCPQECEKIYNKYSELLSDRYANNIEKLDSKVHNQPVFGTRARKDRNTWFYWIFGY